MFLTLSVSYSARCTASFSILAFLEDHSVLVGIATAAFASSMWFRIYIRQKRAEAFFGFYTKLMLRLKSIVDFLKEMKLLEVTNEKEGNIYSLMYDDTTIQEVCPAFRPLDSPIMEKLRTETIELKRIVLESENNVYPKNSDKREWYSSQLILLGFCEFIEKGDIKTNKARDERGKCKHLKLCKDLIYAIDYIVDVIEEAIY